MAVLRISEVASRTGFSPATLRYYEQISLLPTRERTGSGYRLYDEQDLALLSVIRRAKRLGLTLTEVRELVGFWSAGDCPTARRQIALRLAAKLGEVQVRIAELSAFAEELACAHDRLLGEPAPQHCGATCGCPPDVLLDEAPAMSGTTRSVGGQGRRGG